MERPIKIGFAGTDARTLLSALTVSTAASGSDQTQYRGVVVRGTSAMPTFAQPDIMGWDIDFIETESNSVDAYAEAIVQGLKDGRLDYVIPMPEALLFNGLVDRVSDTGLEDRVAGFTAEGAFIEGDKILCKELCRDAGIPVADQWRVVDARSFAEVRAVCLDFLHTHGGAVLKYPYSAGGKGARIIFSSWEIRDVYDTLMNDYTKSYRQSFRKNPWPLLIESRMAGVEISFTILVDAAGNFQILPTAMDYPERFAGTSSSNNPITGGMGSISPHPFETPALMRMAEETLARPLVEAIRKKGLLRPCVLYPGCFASFSSGPDGSLTPTALRVCEVNIRPGEPEFQAVIRRLRNPGQLFCAMFTAGLDNVSPEVREDQVSVCTALVTGPGGPDGQKGYPWSVTRNEPVEIDFGYMKKKKIQVIPAAMAFSDEKGLVSDGTRVAYLNLNGTVKQGQDRGRVAQTLKNRTAAAFNAGKIRVIPREDPDGNRLAFRSDIGDHFSLAEAIQK